MASRPRPEAHRTGAWIAPFLPRPIAINTSVSVAGAAPSVDGARSHAAQGLEETIMGWLTGLEPGKGV